MLFLQPIFLLSEVPSKISKKNLEETISIISEEFKNTWKIENPSICLLGLNPHAGEGGYIGHEEEEILKPFVNSSKENVYGPISADTAFIEKNIKKYDVFLAMYHDQGFTCNQINGFWQYAKCNFGITFY